ncbi:MAG: S9 family peptidase [Gemmatimonadales bacterium]|nr:S9 family peptidase [Gemmatimonadales bacterium]
MNPLARSYCVFSASLPALAVWAALAVPTTALAQAAGLLAAPVASRRTHVDTIHGYVRRDDYFWLRDKTNPDVIAYLNAENAYADQLLAPMQPLRDTLFAEMLRRIKQTDLSVPYREGDHFYYSRTEEGKQYPIYCRKRGSLDAPEEILLDLNRLAVGQVFMGLAAFDVSDDGNLLAYSLDTTGFRQYALRVKDLRTGRDLPDRAYRTGSVAWAADNRTLFYTIEDAAKRHYRLYRHGLGAATDDLVYEEPDERFSVSVSRTRSGAYLVMDVGSHTTSEVRYLSADRPTGEWRLISPRRQDREYDVDHHGDRFYIHVNDTGRNYRLVWAPVSDPREEDWHEIVPHRADVMLVGMDFFAGHYVLYERQSGLQRMRITDFRGGASHYIGFPEPVYTASGSTNRQWNTTVFRFNYQSFITPGSVYDYDMNSRRRTLLKQTEVLGGYDPRRYVSERVFATASDGARIPISVVYRRGLRRDGRSPVLLNAYGSYGSSSNVTFNSNRLSLLDRGMVFAIAHIRGGGEMGKAWHDDGRMMHKINTFTDFIASAEYLIAQRFTSSERLVIQGGSAGVLLMGAVTNLRPDLFHAVVANVPFVDVINTMLDTSLPLTVGEFEEWGNPRNRAEYDYMMTYSPYDNIVARDYPAMLVTTSLNDSQVLFHEPTKYVARMRSMRTDHNPLIFTINMGAGHGGASGRYDRLREIARDYAFVLWEVGRRN